VGIVDTIAEIVEDKRITAPALLVFGDVVSLHPQFQPIRDFYEIIAEEY
jgi:uroporphyrin-III C-methyltransferase